jgi:uncharacterized protein (DUF362 family)
MLTPWRFVPMPSGAAVQERATVVVESLEGSASPARTIHEVITRALVGHKWGSGDAVFLKPNLTYPIPKPGVTTRVDFIETVAKYFLDRGCRVTIGEGPGGYNGFSMKEAFAAHGLTVVARHLGVSLIELSDWETSNVPVKARRGRTVDVPVPTRLLQDFQAVVSLPVPKVHCMTGVSLGLKNLWGCIADVFRIRFHPFLDEILVELLNVLPVRATILDGLYGLDENGPMVDGVVRHLDWVAASSDSGAHDVVVTRLLGLDPFQVSHLRYGIEHGAVPSLDRIDVAMAGVKAQRFSLKLNLWNRVAKVTWLHPKLTWLVYLSPLAGPIHWLMYRLRRRPIDLSVRTWRGWERS